MTCFNHAETVEIGTCASCHKHLCKDCYLIVRDRVICKSEICKSSLDQMDYLRDQSLRLYGFGKKKPISYFGIGLTLFGLYLLWIAFSSESQIWIPLIGGVFILYMGCSMIYKAWKYHISTW